VNSSEPVKRHLHWVASVVSGLRSLPQLVPFLVIVFLSRGANENAIWTLAMSLLVLPISLAFGIARWWRYRYWVEDGELRVEQGLLVRRRVYLPRERVQAFDVTAGVIQRIFGLVRVEVKSAAAGSQVELSAVSRDEAERLRVELGQSHERGRVPEAPSKSVRYVMTPGQLLLAASTSGQIGVILSGVAWLFSQVEDVVRERLIAYLEQAEVAGDVSRTNPILIASLILAGLLLAWLLSIVGAVVRYGGFSVERKGEDLIVRRGLLERREVAIPVNRVQAIRIVESLARQPLGYGALFVESAGHAEERGKSTYLHPCLPRSAWVPMMQELLPEFAVEPPMQRPPRRAIVRFVVRPILIFGSLATLAVLFVPYGWIAFALPLAFVLLGLLAYRDTGFGTTDQVAVLRSRGTSRHTALVPRRCIQFVSTSRSWFQRRRRVANVVIGAASGASGRRFEAREIDEDHAAGFFDWCSASPSAPDR